MLRSQSATLLRGAVVSGNVDVWEISMETLYEELSSEQVKIIPRLRH